MKAPQVVAVLATGRRAVGAALVAALALGACAEQSLAPAEEPRPPVEATASVDRAVATTGDVLTFTVRVDHDRSLAVEIPEAGAEIQGFRIVDLTRPDPVELGAREVRELVYRLRADLVGSYILPSISVRYRPADAPEGEVAGAVETSEIFVEVESVLPADGTADDIRGLKPLRPIERDRSWWIAATVLAALAMLAVALWHLRRRRAAAPVAPPEPAHQVAFRELDALRATDFNDPTAVRRFYFAISETIRAYVEGRYGLNATDLTSEEIVAELPALEELDPTDRSDLEDFLRHTDQVKFAEHLPSEAEIERTYEGALGFVERTRPDLAGSHDQEELAA